MYVMGSVASSSAACLDQAWGFLRAHIGEVRAMVQSASPMLMEGVIQYCTSGFCVVERADEIEKFFEEHPFPSNRRAISQVLEDIRGSAASVRRMLATRISEPAFWSELAFEPPSRL